MRCYSNRAAATAGRDFRRATRALGVRALRGSRVIDELLVVRWMQECRLVWERKLQVPNLRSLGVSLNRTISGTLCGVVLQYRAHYPEAASLPVLDYSGSLNDSPRPVQSSPTEREREHEQARKPAPALQAVMLARRMGSRLLVGARRRTA
jgi:hypothetical protein